MKPAKQQSTSLVIELTAHQVASRIYTIRGVQILLDTDLAVFFGVKPIRLREQVKRNADRFPDDFMFQLTVEEVEEMVSQNAIPSKQHLGGSLPYVFTEQGIAMLSAVLRSETAVKVSDRIMNAFVEMRKFLLQNAQMFQKVEQSSSTSLSGRHPSSARKPANSSTDSTSAPNASSGSSTTTTVRSASLPTWTQSWATSRLASSGVSSTA